MKKLIFLLLALPFFAEAQIHNQLRAKQLIVDSNIVLRRLYIDSFRLDTPTIVPWLGDFRSLPTVDPVYRLIKGRQDWTIDYLTTLINGVTGCQNKTVSQYSINYAGTNYDFIVSDGTYSIDCNTYTNPVTPISLAAADPSNDRTDVIYLDATGVHVLQGVVAPPGTSVKPLVQGDQIELTHIVVLAGTTEPGITEIIIYDENTESTAAGTGVTVNSAATTPAPFFGTVSTTIGALTNNDLIIWTKVTGTWASLGMDAIQFYIKLGAVLPPTDNLRMTLWNDNNQVSPQEVVVAVNRNDVTNWQPVSISMLAFGQLTNTNFNKVRIRATVNGTNNSLPQIDRMVFVDGIVSPPDALITAGEGLTKLGNQINLGGISGSDGIFTTNRFINTNRRSMIWRNGVVSDFDVNGAEWGFDQQVYSPYQFLSADTLLSNDVDPPNQNIPWSGIFARRDLRYNTGVIRTQKVFGHQFEYRTMWDDTISLNTQGGDYNVGFSTKTIYKPYGSGRQGIRASHGTGQNNSIYYAAPALLAVNSLENQASNWIKVDGHLSGVNSYLVMGQVNPDTIAKYVYFTTGGFISGTSRIGTSYEFAPASYFDATRIDSSYFLFDTVRRRRSYHAGQFLIGPTRGTSTTWSSTDVLKVVGNANITDSLHLGKAHNLGSITGTRFMVRRTSDGAVFEIDPALFGGSITLDPIGASPNANGATLTGSILNLEPANASFGGVVTTGTQTFAGTKIFNSYFQNEVGMALKENVIASSAAPGYVWLYAKTDGLIYGRDDAGVETKLSNDGGGGGSPLFPTTGTGTATGNVIGEVGANTLKIQSGGSDRAEFGSAQTILYGGGGPGTGTVLNMQSSLADLSIDDGAVFANVRVTNNSGSGDIVMDADKVFMNIGGSVGTLGGANIWWPLVTTGSQTIDSPSGFNLMSGTAPSSSSTDAIILYAEDVASSSELKVRDEAGNISTLSPHNFTGIPKGRFGKLSWAFYGEKDGEFINVDMEKALRTIEQQSKEIEELKEMVYKLSGKKYTKKTPVKLVYTGKVKNKPNPNNK